MVWISRSKLARRPWMSLSAQVSTKMMSRYLAYHRCWSRTLCSRALRLGKGLRGQTPWSVSEYDNGSLPVPRASSNGASQEHGVQVVAGGFHDHWPCRLLAGESRWPARWISPLSP